MSKISYFLIIFVIIQTSYSQPFCKEREKNCLKCNGLTNLCVKCSADNYFPDKNGGCEPKCVIGKNYCNLCNEDETLCKSCEPGYSEDKIGGCSYTTNCKNSYKGKCLTCLEDFFLVQENGFCKSKNTEDLKNCKTISNINGTCVECKDGFYLNEGDFKCSDTQFCYESTYGVCTSCIFGYYINKKVDKCVKADIPNCKQTLDGINCDKCNDEYFLSENYQCIETNMCSQAKDGKCIKCIENYFLSDDNVCTNEQNCKVGDKDIGLCLECKSGFYLDDINKKCKLNEDNNDFIFCKKIHLSSCIQCESNYYLGKDSKCSNTQYCIESEKGKCLECQDNYFFSEDGKCTPTENCKIANDNIEAPCDQCIDGYYLNVRYYYKCLKIENETFVNCKMAHYFGNFCELCINNYYMNRTDHVCYDNTDKNNPFYRCATTDIHGKFCTQCEEGYFIGSDLKCTNVENCKLSDNESNCIECIEGYCLDVKNQICVDNDFLDDINIKIYIACNRTNEEGTKCEKCLDGYIVGEDGYCIDVNHCEKKEGEICNKCKKERDENGYAHYYCYNSVFGCIRSYNKGCLKCEDLNYLFACTECEEGFRLTEYFDCKEDY